VSDSCCGPDSSSTAGASPSAPLKGWTWSRELVSLTVAGVAIAVAMVGGGLGWPGLTLGSSLVAIAIAVVEPGRRAAASIRRRVLDINVLMVIAVVGASALGEWVEAAAVVWLFGVAEWLEHQSLSRSRRAIRALMTLAPEVARVRRGEAVVELPVEQVQVGDVVVVGPGGRIPVDGEVHAGVSDVDQSPVTGESWPSAKRPGDAVFAASINGLGALDIQATRLSSDSTLARIVRLVDRAQRDRAPMQTFVDRFARRYTPAVVVLATLVALVPPLLIGGVDGWTREFSVWSYRALALLVVACPCALVISTPVSIVSALTAAARAGVLIKGGSHLERLASIRCVAFDKTGTLTHGRVVVTDVLGVDGVEAHGVLSVAAALESRSEHPIGRAIVSHARGIGLAVGLGEAFRALPGLGAEAMVLASPAIVGSHRLFEERQLCTPSLHARLGEVEGRGGTPVLVGHDGAALGVIGLADELRDAGRETVVDLRRAGVSRVVLLTGDRRANADTAMTATGLDEAHAELMPEDKVRLIGTLRHAHGPVAMVGDGVNDAPALAAADVGIAMGAAGTDVALETADVALMSDDLTRLPYAIRLGHRTRRNIRQNVTLALGLKAAFVVLAIGGVATMWMAVLADAGASLLVTANALRLVRGER
jgi:Cd2+/Zn2+-exporting ATPase